ncbi:MAG: hypothetical protein ACR2NZ_14920 [Rubripirellula sp.]
MKKKKTILSLRIPFDASVTDQILPNCQFSPEQLLKACINDRLMIGYGDSQVRGVFEPYKCGRMIPERFEIELEPTSFDLPIFQGMEI